MAKRRGLGDMLSSALSVVGITEERVSGWLGRPCGCAERRQKLNMLGEWARRVLAGETPEPLTDLDKMVGERPPHPDRGTGGRKARRS